MKNLLTKSSSILFLTIYFLLFSLPLSAALVQVNGKWTDAKYAPSLSIAEHYDLGYRLLNENKWDDSLRNFLIITMHFPESPFYADALFYSGVCYYNINELDLANKQFSSYLQLGGNLKNFEKVFEYKYQIAELYSKGKKKRIFGLKQAPVLLLEEAKL